MTFESGTVADEDRFGDDHTILDLTDEVGLLAEGHVDIDVDLNRVRGLLSALRLTSSARVESGSDAAVYDLAMYKATGSAHLAALFCREFRSTW